MERRIGTMVATKATTTAIHYCYNHMLPFLSGTIKCPNLQSRYSRGQAEATDSEVANGPPIIEACLFVRLLSRPATLLKSSNEHHFKSDRQNRTTATGYRRRTGETSNATLPAHPFLVNLYKWETIWVRLSIMNTVDTQIKHKGIP